jgi:hypothetical protein
MINLISGLIGFAAIVATVAFIMVAPVLPRLFGL